MMPKKCYLFFGSIVILWVSVLTACSRLKEPASIPAPSNAPVISTSTSTLEPTVQPSPTVRIIVVTPEPTNTPTVTATFEYPAIVNGIQNTLDRYAQAFNSNDPGILTEVVDQENKPFRRIVRSRFDDYQSSIYQSNNNLNFTVDEIKYLELGYILAHIETEGGWVADWLFRWVGDHWVITEPTVEQIGEPEIISTKHFTYETYAWSEEVNLEVIDLMEEAREDVFTVLGKVPEEKAKVRILPIYGLNPYNTMGAVAQYIEGSPGNDVIEIYSPHTFAYGFYDPYAGWQVDLKLVLVHEYTHMTHNREFNFAGHMTDWMVEGIADYVSEPPESLYSACFALEQDALIPIIDKETAVYKQDLMHLYSLEKDVGLGYVLSNSLVSFIVEQYGGLDGFWKLASAYDKYQNLEKALQDAFQIGYDDFDQGWRRWLAKLCQ